MKIAKKKYRWLWVILYVQIVLLLVGIGIGVDIIFTNKKMHRESQHNLPFDAIIVPGVPYNGEEISDLMRKRVLWACHLYKIGDAKHIIFSGSAVYTPYTESRVMAAYAEKMGVPKQAIFIEPRAEHSTENIYYAYKIAKYAGFKSIAVATDPFQAYLLKFFVNKHNVKIDFLPFEFGMDSIFDADLSHINIDLRAKDPFIPLPEREGFFQRFRGTLGEHIPRDVDNKIPVFEE